MLEEYYLCYCGNLLPALKPHRMSEMKGKDEEESDVDVLQRDVIEVNNNSNNNNNNNNT